jgi:capsular polysaccharide biosynthesis protein
MNLGEVIRVVGRRWFVIVGFAVFGIIISGLLVFEIGPGGLEPKNVKYTSTATTLLDQEGAQGAQAAAAQSRLLVLPNTYVQIVQSREIANRAAEKLKNTETGEYTYKPEEIMKCTSANSELGTQVLDITSCGDNPTDAAAVTTAVVESMKDWMKERQDNSGTLGVNRLTLTTLTAPKVPTSPSGFPPFMWVFIGAVGGLIVGIIAAFGMESVQTAAEPEALPLRAVPQYAPRQVPPTPQVTLPAAAASGRRRLRRRS